MGPYCEHYKLLFIVYKRFLTRDSMYAIGG